MPTAKRIYAILSALALALTAATDTESPNDAIPKPECDLSKNILMRYSTSSSRLYIESADGITRGGCATLSQIWEAQGGNEAPLYAVDPATGALSDTMTATWLLTQTMYVEDGITLQVRADRAGLASVVIHV